MLVCSPFLVLVTPRHPVRQLELRAVRREPITEKVRLSGHVDAGILQNTFFTDPWRGSLCLVFLIQIHNASTHPGEESVKGYTKTPKS